MRIAFLSPVPPALTGIADYSAEVLELLAPRHAIDVFHDQVEIEHGRLPPSCGVFQAQAFLSRHSQRPYDVAVYQMGNGPHHAFLYDYLHHVPGLLVLHDLVLHHARARTFLAAPELLAYAEDPSDPKRRAAAAAPLAAYRAELAYSYPKQAERMADVHLATVGDLLPYAYPLFRIPVEVSRVTAVHNAFMAEAVQGEVPEAEVVRIPMAAERTAVAPDALRALRARYSLHQDDFVVGSFGLMTREKRLETLARAMARSMTALPRLRWLLVGPVPEREALQQRLEHLGVGDRAIFTGRVPFAELPAHMELADIVVHLRYPSARETSAALLRVLAQGRPTVLSDLEHLRDIPDDAVLRIDVADEEGEVTRAILRLAERPQARLRLGRAAADFTLREHSPARCLDGYEDALERAARMPDPPRRAWPAHWLT